jgi:hypothetical protein
MDADQPLAAVRRRVHHHRARFGAQPHVLQRRPYRLADAIHRDRWQAERRVVDIHQQRQVGELVAQPQQVCGEVSGHRLRSAHH